MKTKSLFIGLAGALVLASALAETGNREREKLRGRSQT